MNQLIVSQQQVIRMHEVDKRVLRLVELLIFEKKIKNATEFCAEIEIQKQNFSKIKKGVAIDTFFQLTSNKLSCDNYSCYETNTNFK